MAEYVKLQSNRVIPPGDTIKDLLEELNWKQTELASRLNMSAKHVNLLIAGEASLSSDTALALSHVLGSTPDFWLNREAIYRARKAQEEYREQLAKKTDWLKEFPIADMVRSGWIRKCAHRVDQMIEILDFFGVASVEAWEKQYCSLPVAFRSHEKFNKRIGSLTAWLRQAEREATAIQCEPFQASLFREEMQELRQATELSAHQLASTLRERCARCGVCIVFLPAPKGCPASGVTRWLTSDKALLVLSLRYKTNDHLWFTFFHECFHLLLHGKKLQFIEGIDGLDKEKEDEADRHARDFLIPRSKAAKLGQMRTAGDIRQLAADLGIAPGIVVGRLQHDKLIGYSAFNELKIRYTWVRDDADGE